ncbi:thump domain-containing protein [Stemphylium lycopersici]|nr:thump domain-containing protein [Stemphylium lycopersici]RAR09519.1 thump domain-containing protein [Stemphylium lycopersici]
MTGTDNAPKKRKAESGDRQPVDNKRAKGKKNWDVPRRDNSKRAIQPGDAGIWATGPANENARYADERQQYATRLYGTTEATGTAGDDDSDSEGGDIEAEISKELADIRKPTTMPLFISVKLDTQCLVFFRTRSPLEPVSFVHKICQDISEGAQPKNLSYVKRLTPITATEKATPQGLETVAKQVLAPHFHGPGQEGKKFLRDDVIKTIASAVGPGHKVDLKGYDLLILVEIYQNVLGMSVVGPDFESLKRFNIEELRQPISSIASEITEQANKVIESKEDA